MHPLFIPKCLPKRKYVTQSSAAEKISEKSNSLLFTPLLKYNKTPWFSAG